MKTNTIKRTLILLSILIIIPFSLKLNAETPQAFNYQAVLRNNAGQVLENENVNVGIALRQGASNGIIVFEEVHSTQTNEFGLVNLQIGSVEPVNFEAIDWSDGPYFLQVSVNGLVMGTSQLLSVPYALYAGKVGETQWEESGSDLYYNDGKIGIGTNNPVSDLSVGENSKFQVQGSTGSLVFTDPLASIRFPATTESNNPMIYQFASGIQNNTRMVLAHSPAFPTWGLQYNDTVDAYNFIGSNNSALWINLAGSTVGIRETNPQAFLQVTGNSATSFPHLNLKEIGADYARIALFNDTHTSQWHLAGLTSSTLADARFNIYHSLLGDIFTVSGNGGGRLGIKSTSPTHDIHLIHGTGASGTNASQGLKLQNIGAGNHAWTLYTVNNGGEFWLYRDGTNVGRFSSTGVYTSVSDARTKSNINPMDEILEKTMQLQPVTYNNNLDKNTDKLSIGFLAQDVEKVFPGLVNLSSGDYDGEPVYTLNYSGFGIIAIKAIQEQQLIIQKQDQRITDLENLTSELQNMIRELMKN
jgi:hypothetical protein